jgi:DNA-binding IclR family transcriptional regulator
MTKPTITTSLSAYLQARRGQRFTAMELAEAIDSTPETVRKLLKTMMEDCTILKQREGAAMAYWMPAGELVPARLITMSAKPYRMPSEMADRVEQIRAQRELYPSRHI